ncbi:hypothetical protein [Pseudomaricurvus sp. HS19]|uniref:hypothetical protein n=1 Tax=Pseudomaricurvus sp. HS19 TaxID=2692626 RepID=UPI00136DD340|nr:hypothetical protein [Pseudomaricurvus sp. HS19]MYM62210.1 hypothetical protein [Pseudomaricurvus sp. HS19]
MNDRHILNAIPNWKPAARLITLLLCLCAGSVAAATMEVVELRHRPPGLLLPELQAVAQATTVAASGNRLVLSGDPGEIEELTGLIQELDQPLAQFRIHVRQSGNNSQQGNQWNTSGQLRTTTQPGTKIRTTTGDRKAGTFTLHSSSTHHSVTTTVGQFSNNSSRGSTQQVRALEGMPAYIETGHEIPFLSLYPGPQGHGSQQQYEPVVTGFYVTPTPAWNNQVQLEISVRDDRYRQDQHQEYIESRGMGTSVRAPLGQWIDLGSSVQQQTDDGRGYTSYRSGNGSNSYRIELMIERSN